ncbi:ATP-dependent RNA helicase HrpA [Thioalkalivibrio sp. HK1]|uniref:ATP-dependent RNA helicase HrpA n=1 Tax=Thioalkalivibrio sp. HK1 TaxID=1469245 RepID=UPI0018CC2E2B|nr:ATP-dependent RNA helicase HrpA [Thioalkalivibrio sp. HK1]
MGGSTATPPRNLASQANALLARLDRCMAADAERFRRRLLRLHLRKGAKSEGDLDRKAKAIAAIRQEIENSIALKQRRLSSIEGLRPRLHIDEDLPIAAHADTIADAIEKHPLILVTGATGSGKSTQLPKICLRAGRAKRAMIGHTQPRRLAARSIAARIADEMGSEVGGLAGLKVRFHQRIDPSTLVKSMSDGILLAETRSDPDLLAYDTLIIDEAHERSLNIDFLLGYLQRLIPRRRDLRVVIASATLEADRLARFFGSAPVIDVPGRSWPIDIRYRPGEPGFDIADKVAAGLEELRHEQGDVLVFLSGEREIRDVAGRVEDMALPDTQVFLLHSRLSDARQQALFDPPSSPARRRIVLATNIAETSLTVPGIRFVIDAGTARISRYAHRTGVQRLPVEAISRAAADQRAGRCGRTAPGICIRLYDEEDFLARPAHLEPEIKRADLSAVLLRMLAMGIAEVDDFPFVDPPDHRLVSDGLRLLREVGAIDDARNLTRIGRNLARLPLDPRIGRILLAADSLECIPEALVIVSFLSVPDPRDRSSGKKGAAGAHTRFADSRSDFLGIINLWHRARKAGSAKSALLGFCRRHFLSPMRMRDWFEVHDQLRTLCREIGLSVPDARRTAKGGYEIAPPGKIHRALLAGLLRFVGGLTPEGDYAGLRGSRFRLASASVLAKTGAPWIVTAAVVNTERPLAFTAGRIRAQWVEEAAAGLVRRTHFDAFFDPRRAEAMVHEQVTLHGLVLIPKRKVRYAPISHAGAREIFLRSGLVEGGYPCHHPFAEANARTLARLRTLEDKLRSPGYLVREDAIAAFFDARLPDEIVDGRSFEQWLSSLDAAGTCALEFLIEDILPATLEERIPSIDPKSPPLPRALPEIMQGGLNAPFPDTLQVGDHTIPLRYRFAPGEEDDGVNATLPLDGLPHLDIAKFEWLVPGMLEEKTLALLRALPKGIRRRMMPLADVAKAIVSAPRPPGLSLRGAIARHLDRLRAIDIPAQAWDPDRLERLLPAWLFMRFEIVDRSGAVIACGRHLDRLERQIAQIPGSASFSRSRKAGQRRARGEPESDLAAPGAQIHRRWDFGALPREAEESGSDVFRIVHLALRDVGNGVVIEHFQSAQAARRAHGQGLMRLVAIAVEKDIRGILPRGGEMERFFLLFARSGATPDWVEPAPASAGYPAIGSARRARADLVDRAIRRAFLTSLPDSLSDLVDIRDASGFDALLAAGRPALESALEDLLTQTISILQSALDLREAIEDPPRPLPGDSLLDIRRQLAGLVHPEFLATTPTAAFASLPRYLKGLRVRLDKLRQGGANDLRRLDGIAPLQAKMEAAACDRRDRRRHDAELIRYRWMLEEYRLSVFAQETGLASDGISEKRLDRQWALIEAGG